MATFYYNTRSRSRSVGLELTKSQTAPLKYKPTDKGKKERTKKTTTSTSIPIYEDSNSARPDLESQAPKKRPKLENVTARVVNTLNTAPLPDPSMDTLKVSSVPAVKKIVLASDEHAMNGAPTGDLYDVQVLEDTDIKQGCEEDVVITIASLSMPVTENWAGQFDQVTNLRQVLLHQRERLSSDEVGQAARIIISAVESLRSTTVRNGLLCMRQFIVTAGGDSKASCLVDIIHCLVKRCHNGPKFLVRLAEPLIPLVVRRLHSDVIIAASKELVVNRNIEVSKRAYLMLCEIASRVASEERESFDSLLSLLVSGTNGKSSDVRASCKKSIIVIRKSMSEDEFRSNLSAVVSDSVLTAVLRSTDPSSASVCSVSKPSALQGVRLGIGPHAKHVPFKRPVMTTAGTENVPTVR